MIKYFNSFIEWCCNLKPEWVGFCILMTVCTPVALFLATVIAYLILATKGIALAVVWASLFGYALYLAFFKQQSKG